MWSIVIVCVAINLNAGLSFKTTDEFLLTSKRLPDDLNYMPSLANGHLGLTVFGNAIYMNGVYNGRGGQSRRARLPNWLNISAELYSENQEIPSLPTDTAYQMLLRDGCFQWQKYFHDGLQTINMTQRIYAHRYFDRAVIYELFIIRNHTEDTLVVQLLQKDGGNTEAFHITQLLSDEDSNILHLKAVTREVEDEIFQKHPTTIYLSLSDHWHKDEQRNLTIESGQAALYYRFILTADLQQSVAKRELNDIMNLPTQELFERHATQWHNFWHNFNISIEGNIELSQIINAGQFYLANSLPSLNTNQNRSAYYGLSPTGLGRGGLDADYQGHNFWDTEIWMLPTITQLSNEWSQELLQYRLKHLPAARYYANITGYKGARFPWESAFTGIEVTNPCCPQVAKLQIHISADILYAIEQLYASTYNRSWLCGATWPLIEGIADFLADRLMWNSTTQQYHIKDVMGPDEDHQHVNDDVYTNVIFQKCLKFASLVQTICELDESDKLETLYQNISNKIFILYDHEQDYHPEYIGYRIGETVKQADVILLGYPLQYVMNHSTRLNDLNFYKNVTRSTGPAMSWSMFAINSLDVNDKAEADFYFLKSFSQYISPIFKVWSEVRLGLPGSANFLTGIGGFLQAVINGYAGIRFQQNDLVPKMIIKQRYLLPSSESLTIQGIKFCDALFQLKILKNCTSQLTCLRIGKYSLYLFANESKGRLLRVGETIALGDEELTIQTTSRN